MRPRDRRGPALAGPVLLACSLTLGCGQGPTTADRPDVRFDVRIDPEPPRVGPATVTVALTDAGGKPIRGAIVRVEGNMNHAGMKPVFGDGREVAPGRYETPLEFTMGGDWFLLVDARLADGHEFHQQIDVPAVRTR